MNIWDKINEKVFIIAEIGKNFIQTKEEKSVEEYLENAKRLVDAAAVAGADAVKFQTHNVEDEQLNIDVTSPHFTGSGRYEWVKRNTEATPVDKFWKPLKKYCDEKGIIFFSTPMSRGAAKILNEQVGVDLWKIGSGDILDFVMLDYLRNTGKPIIISSGMSTLPEVEKSINFLKEKNDKIILLHCVSKYPCPPEELRLRTMDLYKKKFGIPVGFSDHSVEVITSVVAAVMGAQVIEKHFSLSRDLWGSDHKVSMMPDEFKRMVLKIREWETKQAAVENELKENRSMIEARKDSEAKVLQEGEAVFRPLFRKSLMVGWDIKAGEVITAEMLYAMRPQAYAGGLPSEEYESVLGKKIKKDLKKFAPITRDILE